MSFAMLKPSAVDGHSDSLPDALTYCPDADRARVGKALRKWGLPLRPDYEMLLPDLSKRLQITEVGASFILILDCLELHAISYEVHTLDGASEHFINAFYPDLRFEQDPRILRAIQRNNTGKWMLIELDWAGCLTDELYNVLSETKRSFRLALSTTLSNGTENPVRDNLVHCPRNSTEERVQRLALMSNLTS